ncbi:hypothetical protein OC835_006271 [Tilletia horrida]|nr:hypothetical protein OC835_006271 [Tilletia horrida]
MVDRHSKNASAGARAAIDASSAGPGGAGPDSSMDISLDDTADTSAPLAQRVLVRNAVEGAAPSSSSFRPSEGPASSAAAAGVAGGAGPTRRVSTRNSPAPRRPGAVAWKDLTSTFKLGPGASVQAAAPSPVASASGPAITTVVASGAASALDSFAAANAPTGPVAPTTTSTPFAASAAASASTSSAPQSRASSSRHSTGAPANNANSSSSSSGIVNGPGGAAAMTRTASGGPGAGPANGHTAPVRVHPNAAYATEVLGPPPRLPLDPYYPPLVTPYTGTGAHPSSSRAAIAANNQSTTQSDGNNGNGSASNPTAADDSGAPVPAAPAPTTSSSRSKKPLLTINQGTDIGHGAGPAVLPSAIAQALGSVAGKRRPNKSQKAFAASTAPRTTRARSLIDSASASPSPSMPTINLAAVPGASLAAAAGAMGVDAVTTPPLTPSHTSSLGKSAILGLDISSTDTGSDSESVREAMLPAGTAAAGAAAETSAPPELKKRKITARLSRPSTRTGSPAVGDPGQATTAPPSTGASAAEASSSAASAAGPPKPTIADDLDIILSSRRSRRAAQKVDAAAEGAPAAADLSSAESSLSSAPSSQGTQATTASNTSVSAAGDASSSAAAASAPGGSGTTPVKRPRITVKRNGVIAPPPPSVVAAAAAAAAAAASASGAATDLSQPAAALPGTITASLTAGIPASTSALRMQTPPARADSPTISTRPRRGAGAGTSGMLGTSRGTASSTLTASAAPSGSALGVSIGSSGSAVLPSAATGMLTRASTPTTVPTLATGAMAYPTIGAAAHMSGSPQKAAETVGVGMTANGTLAIAPAAEFAAAAAAGGHLSAVQGPAGTALVPAGEKQRPSGKEPKGIFPRLLKHLESTNPVQYELPADIRNYFKGVGTALDGSYLNVGMIKPLRVNKQGLIEDRDPYKLKDKNGKAVLCFHCGGSALPAMPHSGDLMKATMSKHATSPEAAKALSQQPPIPTPDGNWRRILSCDFCAAHWHLDCVSPPMAVMPNMTRKWMCPNHADHAMAKYRVPKSSTGIQPYALPLPSSENIGTGKLYKVRLRNNGDVDIIPDPTDSLFNQDGSTNSATQPGWEELIIGGVNPNGSGQRFRFRVPEKVVRLDFWNRVRANAQPLAVRFGKPYRETDPVLSLDDLADVAMERLRKERVIESVDFTGTETDKHTINLVAKVFKEEDGDGREDFPPARSQREYEEAIERARIHGVIGLEGGILLSKLADAPTVSERSTSGLVDDGPEAAGTTADIKTDTADGVGVEEDAKMEDVASAPASSSMLDPTLLAPPPAVQSLRNRPLEDLRASGADRMDGSPSDAGLSSPASTLTDLSSDDGELSDDEESGAVRSSSAYGGAQAGTLAAYGLKEKDVERLLAIEQLIKVKGEAALLEFLLAKKDES